MFKSSLQNRSNLSHMHICKKLTFLRRSYWKVLFTAVIVIQKTLCFNQVGLPTLSTRRSIQPLPRILVVPQLEAINTGVMSLNFLHHGGNKKNLLGKFPFAIYLQIINKPDFVKKNFNRKCNFFKV